MMKIERYEEIDESRLLMRNTSTQDVSDVVRAESGGVVAGVERAHIEGHTLGIPQTEL